MKITYKGDLEYIHLIKRLIDFYEENGSCWTGWLNCGIISFTELKVYGTCWKTKTGLMVKILKDEKGV